MKPLMANAIVGIDIDYETVGANVDQGDRSLIFYFERGRDGESSRGDRHLGIPKHLSP
jgi:hypothetical protein